MNEQEFWAALAPLPEPQPVFYRLYYDEQGFPLFYSMEDVPGNYIEIDHETYQQSPPRVRVVDGKLTILQAPLPLKFQPSDTGTPCDPRDVCVVVSESHPHIKWSLK